MGGSGGSSGPYFDVKKPEIKKAVEDAFNEFAEKFLPELQKILDDKLSQYNRRDLDLMNERREEILSVLEDLLETSWNLSYGGSVEKHTYVDGLSDVDALLIMKDGNAENLASDVVRDQIASYLESNLSDVKVSAGKIAVTVTYDDGMEVQLIPSVKSGNGFKVPSWTGDGWSKINPQAFKRALTSRNQECNGSLVPTIKLAKAIVATWPKSVQLSGYHVESLAIGAFKGYSGPKTVEKMLPYFFGKAATAVKSTIRDKTGQSVNVDTYMGKNGSAERQKASHWLSQTARKMSQASVQGSTIQWNELFE